MNLLDQAIYKNIRKFDIYFRGKMLSEAYLIALVFRINAVAVYAHFNNEELYETIFVWSKSLYHTVLELKWPA